MQKIIVMQGLPASGKGTWCKEFLEKNPEWVRVNRDDLRRMRGTYWLPKQEDMISKWEVFCIESALESGKNVIIDATNLNPKVIDKWKKVAEKYHTEIEYVFLKTSLLECIERDKHRQRSVGAKVIKGMYRKYENLFKATVLEQDKNLKPAIIVDIDGTIAERTNRGPFDWNRVGEDLPKKSIIEILKLYKRFNDYVIILFSGRDSVCREFTEIWLKKNGVPFDQLHMRKEGDHRKDAVVKEEMFNDTVRGRYYIDFVIDDRKQVVDMWRELGLTCLQVDKGEF